MTVRSRWSLVGPALRFGAAAVIALCLAAVSPATASSQGRPAAVDTVRVAVVEDWPPHYRMSRNGTATGLAVDIMDAVARRVGLEVTYVPLPTFPAAIDALETGDVDVIPDFGITASRRERFSFTRPFDAFRLSMMVRHSDTRLGARQDSDGWRVGVVRSNVAEELVPQRQPGAEIVVFDNVREALFELLAAGVDAVAYPEEVLLALARSAGVEEQIRVLPRPLTEIQRAMAVRQSDTELLDRLNEGLDELVGSQEFNDIVRRWLSSPRSWWTVKRVGGVATVLLAVVLLWMGVWRYRSVSRVAAELRRTLAARDASERARRLEEVRFKTLVETAYEGVVVGDDQNRITFANRRLLEMLGVSEDELLGESLFKYVDEAYRGDVAEGTARRRSGQSDSYDILLRRPDAREVWVLLSVAPLMDDDGNFIGSVGTLADITDRVMTEANLRASEERFRQIAERIKDVFWILSPEEGRIEYVSPGYRDVWGRPPESLYEHPDAWLKHVHPDDRDRVAESASAVIDQDHEQQYRIVRPDGEVRWLWDRAYPLRDENGEVYRVIGVARDITERVQAQEALAEREKRFRAMIENSGDLISALDAGGGMLYQSPPLKRLLGYEADELKGRSVFTFLHPSEVDGVRARWEEFVDRPGATWQVPEFRFRHRDGSWRVWEATLTNLLDDPAVEAVLSNARDVTERREARHRIEEQAALLEKARDAILVRELDHTVRFWNAAAERLYGWSAEEAIGSSILELLYRDPTAYLEATAQVLETGEWVGEIEQVHKEGSVLTVNGRWTLVRDEGGLDRILVINTDVTEQKELREQFLRAQRMESIGALAAGIAHDLNNILAPILLSTGLLKMDTVDEGRHETLSVIEDSARRGGDLVRQILSFARGVEGHRDSVDVAGLLNEIGQVVRETFPRSIRFELVVPQDLWSVSVDATQLHQVLMNLCVNARDAMPDGGSLCVECENVVVHEPRVPSSGQASPGRYLRISVTDSGPGIPSHLVDRVFEPFFTTKDTGAGTGLGLSTVASIVRAYGGFVDVHDAAGPGTRFDVHLPADTGDVPDVAADGVDPPAQGQGQLILVVDDEAAVRAITRQTLEAHGYRVTTAENGAVALQAYEMRANEIDLVLTDVMMPVMDGPALIRTLRTCYPDVRIIAASGLSPGREEIRAADADAIWFLPKPYVGEALLRLVHQVLTTKGSEVWQTS